MALTICHGSRNREHKGTIKHETLIVDVQKTFVWRLVDRRVVTCDLQSTDLGEESPPLPVPQLEVRGTVSLDDADRVQLVQTLLEMSADRTR